jgi:hypothetical protein
MYWLQMSDFYVWPHIQYFDDFSDLKQKLQTTDLKSIHKKMKEEVEIRGLQLNQRWCDVIQKINKSKKLKKHNL